MNTPERYLEQAQLTTPVQESVGTRVLVSNYPPKSYLDKMIDQFAEEKRSQMSNFNLFRSSFYYNNQNIAPPTNEELVREYFSTYTVPYSKCPFCQTVSEEDHLMVYQGGFVYCFHFVCQNINCFDMLT